MDYPGQEITSFHSHLVQMAWRGAFLRASYFSSVKLISEGQALIIAHQRVVHIRVRMRSIGESLPDSPRMHTRMHPYSDEQCKFDALGQRQRSQPMIFPCSDQAVLFYHALDID